MPKRLIASLASLAVLASIALAQTTQPSTAPATAPETGPSAAAPAKPNELKVSLMDGSLLAGKLSVSELTMETRFGTLKIPVTQINSFMPGLQSHPSFLHAIETNAAGLGADAFADREKAEQALLAMGPDIRGELERQLKGAENEKAIRLQKILDQFDAAGGGDDDVDKSHLWQHDDVINTPGFTVVGKITTPGFAVTGSYGTVQIKMEDVREVKIQVAAAEDIRKTFTVNGTALSQRQFTNTAIKVAKGDQIIVTATGSIGMPPWGSRETSTPDGGANFGTVQAGIYTGTLIAKIGDSGSMIKLGSHYQGVADRGGVLFLGIATQQDFQNYNFPGDYQVKVRIVKGQ